MKKIILLGILSLFTLSLYARDTGIVWGIGHNIPQFRDSTVNGYVIYWGIINDTKGIKLQVRVHNNLTHLGIPKGDYNLYFYKSKNPELFNYFYEIMREFQNYQVVDHYVDDGYKNYFKGILLDIKFKDNEIKSIRKLVQFKIVTFD